jgi:hypothetical protein
MVAFFIKDAIQTNRLAFILFLLFVAGIRTLTEKNNKKQE